MLVSPSVSLILVTPVNLRCSCSSKLNTGVCSPLSKLNTGASLSKLNTGVVP